MTWFIKFVLGKLSGPILVWIIVALFAANLATGTLLKRAWTKNAQAELVCINQALRDADAARQAVIVAVAQHRAMLQRSESLRELAGLAAQKEINKRIAEKEIEHAHAIADMETATNEIADDEFFCATEPISAELLIGMRSAAARYNKIRTGLRFDPDIN